METNEGNQSESKAKKVRRGKRLVEMNETRVCVCVCVCVRVCVRTKWRPLYILCSLLLMY